MAAETCSYIQPPEIVFYFLIMLPKQVHLGYKVQGAYQVESL